MIPVIRKIGSYFRKQVAAKTVPDGPYLCGLCGQPTDPSSRKWSRHRRAFIDDECIPSIVVARGTMAVIHWLDSGELT